MHNKYILQGDLKDLGGKGVGTILKLQKKKVQFRKKHTKPNYTEAFTVQGRQTRKRSHLLILWIQHISVLKNGTGKKCFYHGLCKDGSKMPAFW